MHSGPRRQDSAASLVRRALVPSTSPPSIGLPQRVQTSPECGLRFLLRKPRQNDVIHRWSSTTRKRSSFSPDHVVDQGKSVPVSRVKHVPGEIIVSLARSRIVLDTKAAITGPVTSRASARSGVPKDAERCAGSPHRTPPWSLAAGGVGARCSLRGRPGSTTSPQHRRRFHPLWLASSVTA